MGLTGAPEGLQGKKKKKWNEKKFLRDRSLQVTKANSIQEKTHARQ